MSHVVTYQEKVERSPLQLLPSLLEEAELLEDAVHLEVFQRDLNGVIREYTVAALIMFAAAAGTHYYISQDEAELAAAGKKAESSFFSKKTLRNVFGGVGGLALIVTGLAGAASVVNKRETKKNRELLTPLDL